MAREAATAEAPRAEETGEVLPGFVEVEGTAIGEAPSSVAEGGGSLSTAADRAGRGGSTLTGAAGNGGAPSAAATVTIPLRRNVVTTMSVAPMTAGTAMHTMTHSFESFVDSKIVKRRATVRVVP